MAFQITKNDRYLVFGDFNIPKKKTKKIQVSKD